MKRTNIACSAIAVVAALAVLQGCGDDTDTFPPLPGAGGADPGAGGAGGAAIPAPPALGTQIDRFGRPAINTALNAVFEPDADVRGTKKDEWNADSSPAEWSTKYKAEIAKNLAVLDALDGTCGNQIAAAEALTAARYDVLATVLANDRLWVKTDAEECTAYLAVEANAVGSENSDCGGRRLSYDAIDVSYSALAAGDPTGALVGDGVEADADTMGAAFPYLAAPH